MQIVLAIEDQIWRIFQELSCIDYIETSPNKFSLITMHGTIFPKIVLPKASAVVILRIVDE